MPIALVDYNVERSTYRYGLYVKRPADARPVAAFQLTSDEPPTWFEFSPDGRQPALLVRGSLYLVSVD
jgi:hypothetical protein